MLKVNLESLPVFEDEVDLHTGLWVFENPARTVPLELTDLVIVVWVGVFGVPLAELVRVTVCVTVFVCETVCLTVNVTVTVSVCVTVTVIVCVCD